MPDPDLASVMGCQSGMFRGTSEEAHDGCLYEYSSGLLAQHGAIVTPRAIR